MKHMPEKIIFNDPADLKVHPALKHVPEWANDDPDFIALVDDVRARGIDQPLICFDDMIVDGRHRWRSAKRLHLKEVPTVQCAEAEIHAIILGSMLHRRHFTKSALAYLAYPLMADAWEEAKKRQASKQFGKPATGSTISVLPKSVAELAEQCGFSRVLFFQARDIHDIFTAKPKLRDEFEGQILSGDISLGPLKAGIAGQQATKKSENGGIGKPQSNQFLLFTVALDTVKKRFSYWNKFDEDERDRVRSNIRKTVSAMPKDLRDEWEKTLRAIKKEENS